MVMGKKKGRKTTCLLTENLQKEKLQTDMDSSLIESSRPESFTTSSGEARKKQKRVKNEDSRQHTAGQQQNSELREKTKIKHVRNTHSGKEPSNETDHLHQEDVDEELGEKAEKTRKKRKRDKQRETEDNIMYKVSVNDASGRNTRGNVTMELENDEEKSNKKSKRVRKKKNTNAATCGNSSDETANAAQGAQTVANESAQMSENKCGCRVGTQPFKKKKRKRDLTDVDAELLEQLREFVPNIDSRPRQDIVRMINCDLSRYKEFKRKGIVMNGGKFTVKENEMLKKNVEDFMALTGVDNPTKLFFTDRFKEECAQIKKLKKVHKFFERISEGIPRSCLYVYARGRKVFDARNYKGPFTKREINTLLKLHTLHGNNWKKISDLTGRSAYSLQKRYSQLTTKGGPWSTDEHQRLLRAVRYYIVRRYLPGATYKGSARVSREVLYRQLPWTDIAAKVKTRSWTKCREKWMSGLPRRMSSEALHTNKKNEEVKVKLIKALYEMQVEDIALVNWEDLTEVIGDVPPAYVQRKWHKLKICHVPRWQTMCFADTIDFLYEKVLPRLEKELKSYEDDEDDTPPKVKQQESFRLSDIFHDIDDDGNDDDDNDDDGGGGGGKVRRKR
ncbi:transcription termination factor 1 [Electrophorus electricus]|uniref:Transcription termination factor 1, tandem duplicate 4 n=1 Tax=Electrophorus electricus TaxID=8005 RepID=A0A4W4HMA1_ELEEL|nr:transcription termination factor 1 [Electrophorus electricus]